MTNTTAPRPGSRRAHVLSLAQQQRGTITPSTFADMLGLTPGVTVGEQTITRTSVAGTLADAQGRLWTFEYDQDENRILAGFSGGEMTAQDRVEWIEQISAEGAHDDRSPADGCAEPRTPEPVEFDAPACPTWCTGEMQPHWTRRGDCREALHVRHFGDTVKVYVLEERNPECEVLLPGDVVLTIGDREQLKGELSWTADEALPLTHSLMLATSFAQNPLRFDTPSKPV